MKPKQKFEIVTRWYQEGKILKTPDGNSGAITEEPKEASGIWGYEGDSIAVYINNKPYQSQKIITINID